MKILLALMMMVLLCACNESETENYSKDFTNHPLSGYFVPHGTEALLYLGRFWNTCDKKHPGFSNEACDEAVERGIRIGKSVGIELVRNDLVNEKYWEKFREVAEESRVYREKNINGKSGARFNNKPSAYEVASEAFRAQQNELLKNMDEDYGR